MYIMFGNAVIVQRFPKMNVLTIQTWQNVKASAQKELSRAEQLLYLQFDYCLTM